MSENQKMSKLPERFKNIIAFTDDMLIESELITLTFGGLNSKERLSLLDIYLSENDLSFNKKIFTSNRNSYYILWVGAKPIGLLSLELSYYISEPLEGPPEATFSVNVLGIFIIEEYRGIGLGGWLASESAIHVRSKLLYKATRDLSSLGVFLHLHADYESEEGEKFCELFYSEIHSGCLLEKMLAVIEMSFSSSIDAGY